MLFVYVLMVRQSTYSPPNASALASPRCQLQTSADGGGDNVSSGRTVTIYRIDRNNKTPFYEMQACVDVRSLSQPWSLEYPREMASVRPAIRVGDQIGFEPDSAFIAGNRLPQSISASRTVEPRRKSRPHRNHDLGILVIVADDV